MRAWLGAALAVLVTAPASAAVPGATLLVDSPLGALPSDSVSDSVSGTEAVSEDGNLVVFVSGSDALLPAGADKSLDHVFVHDRTTSTTTPVDTTPAGVLGDESARAAAISGNGDRIVFISAAHNLAPDPTTNENAYVKDLSDDTITQLTPEDFGVAGPVIDRDGAVVAFATAQRLDPVADTNLLTDVYRHVVATGTNTLMSRADGAAGAVGNQHAIQPSISDDGAVIAFTTRSALDAAKDTNGADDVYTRSADSTTLVSRIDGADTNAGDNGSSQPSLRGDGTAVAFTSNATDLVAGDGNGGGDVFVRSAGVTELVSRPSGSTTDEGDGRSFTPAFNRAGTHVAFLSRAGNLVAGAAGSPLAYVRALAGDTTEVLSRTSAGGPIDGVRAVAPNEDASVAVFAADGDATSVFAREGAETELISGGTSVTDAFAGAQGAMSADGRMVAFVSGADAFSTADDDRFIGAYLKDVHTGALTLLTPGADGVSDSLAPVVSADGSMVAFATEASNLGGGPGIYVQDAVTGTRTLVTGDIEGSQLSLNADGSRIAFSTPQALDAANDSNGASDVYVRDLDAQVTLLASRADGAGGAAGNGGSQQGVLDGSGQHVAFATSATDLGDGDTTAERDVHVRDLAANTTTLASRRNGFGTPPGNGDSGDPSISEDGTLVAFTSGATDLDPDDGSANPDAYVRDVLVSTTELVTRDGPTGQALNADTGSVAISGDGTRVAFRTDASELVPPGADRYQVFVRNLVTGADELVSRADGASGAAIAQGAVLASINSDGSCVGFGAGGAPMAPGGYASPDWAHLYLRAVHRECPLIPPETTIVPSDPGSVAFESSEAGSTFACRADAAPFAPCTSPVTVGAPSGTHTFEVRAIDPAGLTDPTPAQTTYGTPVPSPSSTPDTTAPVISRVSVSKRKLRLGKKGRLRFTLSEAATVTIELQRRNGKKYKAAGKRTLAAPAGRSTVAFTKRFAKRKLRTGRHRFRLRATDVAGNRSSRKSVAFRTLKPRR